MSQYSPVNAERRSFVDLDRHFHEFTKEELADEELLAAYNEEHSWHPSLSWDELLKRKRIIVLASAGSGKTEEMEQRKKKLESERKHAFYVRLEELGQDGFVDLLKPNERQQFHEWQSAPSTPAWFFLDSVDELKLTQRTLESAFRHLTQALHKDLHRSHIIVSSRPTDWRPASDETKFREWLPLPAVLEENQASADEVFLAALSRRGLNDHESRKTSSEAQDQRVTTVLLLPFAERQIKNFARQWNVTNPDQFFQEITKNNAWSFARRPLDLIELISLN